MKPKIILNAIRCDQCLRVLVSLHRHDFRQCECGTFTDGGKVYLHRGFKEGNTLTDLTLVLKDGIIYMQKDLPDA